jgi:uncharacterized pyridoxal phosphate-containing UPF0001 family protein
MDEPISLSEAKERLAELKSKLEAAARKSARDPQEISLLAVSKTFPAESIDSYILSGQKDFGESYVQEAKDKIPLVKGDAIWHFIGHLQTNKAKYAVRLFPVIHALDSLSLAAELHKRLGEGEREAEAEAKAEGDEGDERDEGDDNKGIDTDIAKAKTKTKGSIEAYIQVNVSGEGSKSGLSPEELPGFLEGLSRYPRVIPIGLMTMPPYDPDPEESRPFFIKLRELRDKEAPSLKGLSMGMSGDYEVAIEEGATIVRVGTALFGERNYR